MKAIAYLRVSTERQGRSGLGLEAQRDYIRQAANAEGWEVIDEVIESGISGTIAPEDRPGMSKAIRMAKEQGAVIVAAKLDRLSRDVEHVAGLMKRIDFRVATIPRADSFQLHLFAALAEQEREFIASRTSDALKALQARADAGNVDAKQKIQRRNDYLSHGRTPENAAKARSARTDRSIAFAHKIAAHLKAARYDGVKTLRQAALYLNERGITTARGCMFTAVQVKAIAERSGVTFP